MDTQSPPPVQAPVQAPLQASARPVLADLIAAGLVSHEMIGDPAQLGSEAEALRVLCAGIGGPVWRLDPFHYAFRARPEDLGGRLAGIDPAGWAGGARGGAAGALGRNSAAEAVWISAADLGRGRGAAARPAAPAAARPGRGGGRGARGGRSRHPGGGPGPLRRRGGAARRPPGPSRAARWRGGSR